MLKLEADLPEHCAGEQCLVRECCDDVCTKTDSDCSIPGWTVSAATRKGVGRCRGDDCNEACCIEDACTGVCGDVDWAAGQKALTKLPQACVPDGSQKQKCSAEQCCNKRDVCSSSFCNDFADYFLRFGR